MAGPGLFPDFLPRLHLLFIQDFAESFVGFAANSSSFIPRPVPAAIFPGLAEEVRDVFLLLGHEIREAPLVFGAEGVLRYKVSDHGGPALRMALDASLPCLIASQRHFVPHELPDHLQ